MTNDGRKVGDKSDGFGSTRGGGARGRRKTMNNKSVISRDKSGGDVS
jgi:hypothetical protein